ncbi:hypothetical protein [Actinocrispum wychmicini]|nr:hypothetical protein [Actinocrispum wychmicini]
MDGTMPMDQQVIAPGHPIAERWITRPDCRLIGVVMPHDQATARILDVLPQVEADPRVQAVFITPATGFQWARMEESARSLGGLWVPWRQALEMPFDLVLAACHWGIQDLSGPVLLMPHGVGLVRSRISPWDDQAPHDLYPGNLMRGNEVIPSRLALAHDGELAALAESCPQAMPQAIVAGDPCFDRMLASQPYRQLYREALGVRDGQRLVVVSTTWSPHSLFGTDPGIFARLTAELPGKDYRVVGVLHPFIWRGHSRRQVLAWLAKPRTAGLHLVPPEEGWRAAVVGADLVMGDHGSVTMYGAGLDRPILMNTRSLADVRPGSPADILAQLAAPLHVDRPLLPQVERAIASHVPQRYARIAEMITSRPGQSATILRQTIYRLLNLPEPSHDVPVSAVPLPRLTP